jgi:hypothetical protein
MLTVAVVNTGNCPEVTPLGYVTEITPALVDRLLPHPDTATISPISKRKEIDSIASDCDVDNKLLRQKRPERVSGALADGN